MEINEVETSVSILTTEVQNISDTLDEFKKPFNTLEDFLNLLHSEEVKINVELSLERENNECNEDEQSSKNEQHSHTLDTDCIEKIDSENCENNGENEKNQDNALTMDVDENVKILFYFYWKVLNFISRFIHLFSAIYLFFLITFY